MKIEITENEIRVLKRIKQLYYDGMYGDIYKKNDETPCDKYCENFMKTTIEGMNIKIDVALQNTKIPHSTSNHLNDPSDTQRRAYERSLDNGYLAAKDGY